MGRFTLNTYGYRHFGNLGIQAKFNISQMRNYQWQLNNNKINIQFQLTLEYHL